MRIALIEDDVAQAEALRAWLAAAGHDPHLFGTARDLLRETHRESFDLFLVDWMLPDASGLDVLHRLRGERGETAPIIFATARDAEEDIVAALAGGADDYMVKPLRQRELLARIDAVWRRQRPPSDSANLVEVPPFRFEIGSRRAWRHDQPLDLTEKEFHLAVFLFRNIGRLLSRGHLLEAVWGLHAEIPTRTLDTHISRIRNKLDLSPAAGFRLAPTYSYGYRLERAGNPA